jgi:hypothetical protein
MISPALVIFVWACTGLLWLWSLIHCVQNKKMTDHNRLIAVLLIVFLSLLGSLIYLFMKDGSGTSGRGVRGRQGMRPSGGSGFPVRGAGRSGAVAGSLNRGAPNRGMPSRHGRGGQRPPKKIIFPDPEPMDTVGDEFGDGFGDDN